MVPLRETTQISIVMKVDWTVFLLMPTIESLEFNHWIICKMSEYYGTWILYCFRVALLLHCQSLATMQELIEKTGLSSTTGDMQWEVSTVSEYIGVDRVPMLTASSHCVWKISKYVFFGQSVCRDFSSLALVLVRRTCFALGVVLSYTRNREESAAG